MAITIALAGNPNSGKTTLFNALTGSNQHVGNWPGVTVEKKTGNYKKDKNILITDLPGVYSLSPYTLEEVVSRNYLIDEDPDVIIDVIDASNIERNLYLATQLAETGIPLILAFNMMDIVRKNKDVIDTKRIEMDLGCKIVEISALHRENLDHLVHCAILEKERGARVTSVYSDEIENILIDLELHIQALKNSKAKRWYSVKILEEDQSALEKISLSDSEKQHVREILKKFKETYDDDGEGVITDERYNFISQVVSKSVVKGTKGLTTSDKIDRIVTNRLLAVPIFVVVMYVVYYISVAVVGGPVNDWWADGVWGEMIPNAIQGLLESLGVSGWVESLILDGVVAGVGGVIGFLPVIAILQLFIAMLEDVGYMSRIAFILDRVFRKFGLSGKSFIPVLIGTGCSVSGIMGTRTIENENDRKLTIIVASFMPCGAKSDIIALLGASVLARWWFAPMCYFMGIISVILSGIILKKTKIFAGEPAPFVMELPNYHAPKAGNIAQITWDRVRAFLVKAGTIILLTTIAIWFLKNISVRGEFHDFAEANTDSVLAAIGKTIAPVFGPLGFGDWISAVATILGLVAKEVVVGTIGVVTSLGEENVDGIGQFMMQNYTMISAFSFMMFNQLCIPCFAAVGSIHTEMKSAKWTSLALCYQMIFAYCMSLIIYQFGTFLTGGSFTVGTASASIVLAIMIYLLLRKDKYHGKVPARRAVTE